MISKPTVSCLAPNWDIDFYISMTIDLLRLLSLQFLLLFSSFSVSLINPSTRVGSVYLLPFFIFFLPSLFIFISIFSLLHLRQSMRLAAPHFSVKIKLDSS